MTNLATPYRSACHMNWTTVLCPWNTADMTADCITWPWLFLTAPVSTVFSIVAPGQSSTVEGNARIALTALRRASAAASLSEMSLLLQHHTGAHQSKECVQVCCERLSTCTQKRALCGCVHSWSVIMLTSPAVCRLRFAAFLAFLLT